MTFGHDDKISKRSSVKYIRTIQHGWIAMAYALSKVQKKRMGRKLRPLKAQ